MKPKGKQMHELVRVVIVLCALALIVLYELVLVSGSNAVALSNPLFVGKHRLVRRRFLASVIVFVTLVLLFIYTGPESLLAPRVTWRHNLHYGLVALFVALMLTLWLWITGSRNLRLHRFLATYAGRFLLWGVVLTGTIQTILAP